MSHSTAGTGMASGPIELSYVSLAGENVPSATRENVLLLQHAADYVASVRRLRRSGVVTLVWGVLNTAVFAFRFVPDLHHLLGEATGIILIGVGCWNITRPSPVGLLMDAGVFLLVATVNAIFFVTAFSRGTVDVTPLLATCFQTYWAFNRLNRYPRFARAVAMQPSPATIAWLRELATQTMKANPKLDPLTIAFKAKAFIGGQQTGKARLLPELAVFVLSTAGSFSLGNNLQDVVLASQEGVHFERGKKVMLRKAYKFKLQIGDRKFSGTMPEASLLRFEQWLQISPLPLATPAPPPLPFTTTATPQP